MDALGSGAGCGLSSQYIIFFLIHTICLEYASVCTSRILLKYRLAAFPDPAVNGEYSPTPLSVTHPILIYTSQHSCVLYVCVHMHTNKSYIWHTLKLDDFLEAGTV